VNVGVPAWLPEELLAVVGPLYPTGRRAARGKMTSLVALLGRAVHRVPNPAFTSRRSGDRRTAARTLFDRADALLYAAQQWGGLTARLQAAAALAELGPLRDWRFVVPALAAADVRERLAGAACLAFLRPDDPTPVHHALRRAAAHDTHPGVRRAALWGYGFAGGPDACDLARDRGDADPDARTRTFAARITAGAARSPDQTVLAWWRA
jgi:hypothetical protein